MTGGADDAKFDADEQNDDDDGAIEIDGVDVCRVGGGVMGMRGMTIGWMTLASK